VFAAKDTPVLSTTSGLVTGVGSNNLGGRVVWVLGPGLERHYYAHLNRYGDVHVGDRIEAGTIIGYAGNTGNARGGAVHLHYGIYRNGTAQNPYPRLPCVGESHAATATTAIASWVAKDRASHFQVISIPKKCMNTWRVGRFLGFICGLRM
jgi:murein DD-endopeptidase MepM/ murein hydrolase activator NlpD